MPPVASSDRPRVYTRPSGWPVRRSPRWLLLAGVLFVIAAVAVALVHRPSTAERATDMRGFLSEVNTDIESCSGGVRESLIALADVQAGHFSNSTEIGQGISVATQGAANCAPANNEQIDDLENYQVPESLASYRLQNGVNDVISWAAPNAIAVQTDVATVLQARGTAAEAADQAKLSAALGKLDAERAAFEAILQPAIRTLHPATKALGLPG
jgi:hypothetical protein